jgi:hypothetical protein
MPEVPTLVRLHALDASRRSFDGLAAELADRFEVLALDLHGDFTAVAGPNGATPTNALAIVGNS